MAPRKKHSHSKRKQMFKNKATSSKEKVVRTVMTDTVEAKEQSQNASNDNRSAAGIDLLCLVEKTVMCLRLDEKKVCSPILEQLPDLLGKPSNKRKIMHEILCTFLEVLFDCKDDEFDILKEMNRNIFVRKSLRKFIVESAIRKCELIAMGGFGAVYSGYLKTKGERTMVAIKESIHPDTNVLRNEALVMSQLDHPNILKLLAVQTNPYTIAVEYMPQKDIIRAVEDQYATDEQLLGVIHDVALGMEYMVDKKFVHRDLACRNAFVDNSWHCKIGDFGLSCYVGDSGGVYYDKIGPFQQYHIAPEVYVSDQFSSRTDVYAMGVLIWEMYMAVSHEELPVWLQLLGIDPRQLELEKFRHTGELIYPSRCCRALHNYVKDRLLNENPEERPTFTDIKTEISKRLELISTN